MDPSLAMPQFIDVKPGGIIAQRYKVVEKVAAGGMGIVFKVIDQALNDEIVALKLLNPHLSQDETVFKRFLNEVLVARSLSHPNIVRTHDIGKTAEGASYISMEYVDGVSLAGQLDHYYELCQKGSRDIPGYRLEEAVYILLHVLRGIAYAHEQGIIHRDLKPANILLTKKNEIKVADFGTARIVGANTALTQDGSIMGTPDYMSPEQISGEELDARCDIYALGIIAYELVVGDKPFQGDNLVQVAYQHVSVAIPGFEKAGYEVPEWYQDMVRTAAAKKREDRYQSAEEFASVILENCKNLAAESGTWPAMSSARLEAITNRVVNEKQSAQDSGLTHILADGFSDYINHRERHADKGRGWLLSASLGVISLIVLGIGFATYSNKSHVPIERVEIAKNDSAREESIKAFEDELRTMVPSAQEVDENKSEATAPAQDQPELASQNGAALSVDEQPKEEILIEVPSVDSIATEVSEVAEATVVQGVATEVQSESIAPNPVEKELVKQDPAPPLERVAAPPPPRIDVATNTQQPVLGRSVGGALSRSGSSERDLLSTSQARYRGTLGSAGAKQGAVTMNLAISDSSISGSASIDGRGEFRVSGTLHSRGLEMTLSNSRSSFRLTGSKRQNVLRGTYTNMAENERGSWQVSLQ